MGAPTGRRRSCASCAQAYPHLRSVRLRRNAGKAAALAIGFDLAVNDIFVMMDADGQDEPREIPALLAKLDEGFDLVTGRRATRQDRFLKRHTSQLYNATTSWVSGVPGRDFNSGLKVTPSRSRRDRQSLRRAPPVPAGPGRLVRVLRHRSRGRAPSSTAWQDQVRDRPILARPVRSGHRQVHHLVQPPTVPPLRRGRTPVGIGGNGSADLDVHPAFDGSTGGKPSCSHHRSLIRSRGGTALVVRLAGRAPRLPVHRPKS